MSTPPVFADPERIIFAPLAQLAVCNPFTERRIHLEKQVLGRLFRDPGRVMSPGADPRVTHDNIRSISGILGPNMPFIRDRYKAAVKAGASVSDADRATYIGIALYYLYDRYDLRLQTLIDTGELEAPFYDAYCDDYGKYLGFLGPAPDIPEPVRAFEIFFQVRRAFHFLYVRIRGRSMPIALLRARIWDVIFGGSLDEYAAHMWDRMVRFSTLIQGPTGTGKELVARAIAGAGLVPFDAKGKKFAQYDHYYAAINLLAFAPGLLASELFGHVKGAFTDAGRDKRGIFEMVPMFGAILLDEIAEIDISMQIQLLRVLQERRCRRVGDESGEYPLEARILTATHRDPAERMAAGLLREDFFRRICMLKILTPSLRERFDDCPDELADMVGYLAADLMGPGRHTASLTDETVTWIQNHLPHHPWTGNMRELLQCVADVKTSHAYVPERYIEPVGGSIEAVLAAAKLPVDEVVRRHAVATLARTANQAETARALGVDVRRLKRILAVEPPAPRSRRRGR